MSIEQLLDTPVGSSLPERQMVWCLESPRPGRLCIRGLLTRNQSFILVFNSEDDAIDHIVNGRWFTCERHGISPIQMSIESVEQQSREQGPDPLAGLPCVGYVWMPQLEFVEVPA